VRTFIVVTFDELIELCLLLQEVLAGWLGGIERQGEMRFPIFGNSCYP
jgi:hypothetical protein